MPPRCDSIPKEVSRCDWFPYIFGAFLQDSAPSPSKTFFFFTRHCPNNAPHNCTRHAHINDMSIKLNFEPHAALVGGGILGVATVGKLLLTGRILGISGALKGVVENGDLSPWRLSFLGGLVAAGVVDGIWDPNQIAEPGVSLAKTVLAGLLVGAGSAMGNGCTSGHGICGNSRMSPRSMAYTGIFMVSGFIVASVFNTNGDLGINSDFSAIDNMVTPAAETLTRWLSIAGAATLGFLGIGQVASAASKKNDGDKTKLHKTLDALAEALAGFTFGLGLTVSGMRRAAKVSGFLSATRASFDPSLMLVMGGAMALSIPGFAIANKKKAPACTREFSIPKNRKIDDKLMLGGVLFGAGWGLAGMCPGPAIVSLAARPTQKLAAWIVSVLGGMWIQKYIP